MIMLGMLKAAGAGRGASSVAVTLALITVTGLACTDGTVPGLPGSTGFAVSYGIWSPGTNDTCTEETHNGYSVVGEDGKTYPTWHPPVDPATGCSFGHEHGRDPRGSDLYGSVGDIPFGFANEQLDEWDPSGPRHEDHFGHKVEWQNDVEMRFEGDVTNSFLEVRCDIYVKMHQGSHSRDAFANNLHELSYHANCSDGTEMHITFLAAIGNAGEFVPSCDGDARVQVGTPSPANSPDGGGRRIIPDRTCLEQLAFVGPGEESELSRALRESWQISSSIRSAEGENLARVNPYFQVLLPSRYYDPAEPNVTGRPIVACSDTLADGSRIVAEECDESTSGGTIVDMTFDDPRSVFDGAHRFMDINSITISNRDGPRVWYTDPFGKNGQHEPFPGSVRQVIATIDNDRGIRISGPAIGKDRPYGTNGVHAPN